jgi:ABC-2 type transport system ATP-binding protein
MAEETIITTTALTKRYGELTAVDHLDLSIRKGEIFGLLGPNGAGKTTTTLMLLGLTEPSGGRAEICGHDCTREPIAVKRITGYLPDNVGFYNDMTGRENLRFTARLNELDPKTAEERINAALERADMTYAADRKTGTYSRGMRQRLGIADVLLKDPQIIIMDEPTIGLDPEGIRELDILIRRLAVEDGRTILISSHQLYQVQQICDRVGIFVKGKLIACGPISDLARQLESEGNFLLELDAEPRGPELEALVRGIGHVSSVKKENQTLLIRSDADVRGELMKALLAGGYSPLLLRQRSGDLDEIYRRYFEKAGDTHGREASTAKGGPVPAKREAGKGAKKA